MVSRTSLSIIVEKSANEVKAGSRLGGSRAIHLISLSNGTFRGGAAESHCAFSAYICRVDFGSVMVKLAKRGSGLLTLGEFAAVWAQAGDR